LVTSSATCQSLSLSRQVSLALASVKDGSGKPLLFRPPAVAPV
jgi:hypothetical protein